MVVQNQVTEASYREAVVRRHVVLTALGLCTIAT